MFVKIREYGVLVPGERTVDGNWSDGSISLEQAFGEHGVWVKQDMVGKSRKFLEADKDEEEVPKISDKKVGVRVMDFKGCGLTDMTLRKVAHIVKVNTTLELLHVPWNRVSDEGATCLGQSLGHNCSLVSLDLSRNSIGDEGCLRLCEGVRANSTLTKLNLDYNVDIGGPGVKGVAEMLLENSRLTELGLSGIGVGNKGALQLASALLPNTTMTVLGLSRSSIGPEGATALAKALSAPLGGNQTLLSLDLSSNHIGDLGARALSTALRPEVSSSRPSTSAHPDSSPSRAEGLTDLDLRDNKLGPKAMTDIAAMLKANRVLRSLNASHNRCEDAGGNAIGKAITYNKSIKSLHFFDKTIGVTTCKWLSEVLAAVEIEHFDFELQMLMPSEEMEAKQRPESPTASMMLDGSWLSMLAQEREEQARIAAEEEELSKAEKASTSGVLPGSSTMKKGTAVGKVAGSPGTRMSPSGENSQAAMKTSPLRENSPSSMVRRGVNAEK